MRRLFNATRLATALWLICFCLTAYTVVLRLLIETTPDAAALGNLAFAVLAMILPTCGTIVAARRSENPVGWLVLGAAVAFTGPFLSQSYNEYIYETAIGSLPAASFVLWLGWLGPLGFGLLLLSFLLFPTGRLPSPRWRIVLWASVAAIVAGAFGRALAPGPLPETNGVLNPVGVEVLDRLLAALRGIYEVMFAPAAVLIIASLAVRFRRGGITERTQIKWVVYVVVLGLGLTLATEAARAFKPGLWQVGDVIGGVLTWIALPVALAVSILRHNLFDIAHIISRTMTYGLLTAGLGAIYAGLVLSLQALLRPLNEGSELALVATTLLVAALSLPARRRVQDAVDRRFFRQKFDTERTLQAFSVTARDAVDPDQLTRELTQIVSTTMQPEHVSVWLRTGEDAR